MITELRYNLVKRIVVNKHVVRSNAKNARTDPPLSIQTSSGVIRAHSIEIHGPSTLVYRPEKPLKCGAAVYIETRAAVTAQTNEEEEEGEEDNAEGEDAEVLEA